MNIYAIDFILMHGNTVMNRGRSNIQAESREEADQKLLLELKPIMSELQGPKGVEVKHVYTFYETTDSVVVPFHPAILTPH